MSIGALPTGSELAEAVDATYAEFEPMLDRINTARSMVGRAPLVLLVDDDLTVSLLYPVGESRRAGVDGVRRVGAASGVGKAYARLVRRFENIAATCEAWARGSKGVAA